MVEMILFCSSFMAGISFNLFPKSLKQNFDFTLIFSGSYIFALTMMHIIPEVFAASKNVHVTGLFILLGFFCQTLLELVLNNESSKIENNFKASPMMLVIGLCLHAFFEATLLYGGGGHHPGHGNSSNLLIGIVMHRIPVTIALVTILKEKIGNFKTILGLIAFSLASPIGLLFMKLSNDSSWLSSEYINALNAFVAGGFLHVTLDIFHDLQPDSTNGLNKKKLGITVLGVSFAMIVEYFL